MTISERIFEIMGRQGLSQKEFSERTGIPQSTISDWKGKKVNPGADKIMIICEVLSVHPYELLSGTENKNYEEPDFLMIDRKSEEYLLLEKYRSLDTNEKARVRGYLEALDE